MAESQHITVFYSRHFVLHLWICNRICVKLLQLMYGVITQNSVKKNEVSILINGWVTANYSVSRPPFCPPFGICNPICVKLLQAMFGVISRNLKKRLYLKSFSWSSQTRHTHTDAQTHRHTHMSIAIGEMQCVAFRLKSRKIWCIYVRRCHL